MTLSSARTLATAFVVVSALATTLAVAPPPPVQAAALAPTNAPDGVIPADAWVDEFEGTALDARWRTVNPSGSAVTVTGGAARIASQGGDTWQTSNTATNLLMVDVPDADFTAVTALDAPATLDYQGAGLMAWQDIDNYVRAGLAHVGFTTSAPHDFSRPEVLETGVEVAAAYSSTFASRPGSTSEIIRLQRTGDTLTTSYWADGAWQQTASTELQFPVTQVGLYALAAQDGTSHTAAFDYFALTVADGDDVVPEGTFTLRGTGEAQYLAAPGGVLGLAAERPTSTLALTAAEVAGEPGVITLGSGGYPVVLQGAGLAMGEVGAEAARLRLTDAGGGTHVLRTATATSSAGYVGLDPSGAFVLGAQEDAVRLVVTTVSLVDGASLDIDGDATSIETSDELYGIFYEDINYAADGGLYAELVRNRSFEFNSSDNGSFNGLTSWEKLARGAGAGSTSSVVNDAARLNEMNRNYLKIEAAGAGAGVRNASYNAGVPVKAGEKYDFTVWARSAVAQTLDVVVENAGATQTYATGAVAIDGSDVWKKYAVTLTATATTDAGRLAVLAGAAGTLRLDMISLFPQDTWVGPVNGKSPLRKDLAEKIVDMAPKFLRFPGGCVTNVGTFKTYEESGFTDRQRTYQWKETIGPVEERPTNWNFWGYNQSYGIGYLEYFELAEDLGAVPLPVVSVGANGCGSTIPEMKDPETIARWVDDTVDLIEFAIGDTSTEWGAIRAGLGHPEPFDLRYIGLGNEENTTTFEANFPAFRDAIAARYPQIEIISNSGPDSSGSRFDTLWAFNREQDVDMVDEHYYRDPSWFIANHHRYDSYDRNGPAVFLGEYASRGNTLWNAVAEASYMTALERNSDVVRLASYAPLLSNESYVQWSPDAIWFDNDESWGTPNYYVQKMFAQNHGDEVVPSTFAGAPVMPRPLGGGVFLSTWSTAASYDDVRVTSNADGAVLFEDDFTDASGWEPKTGSWSVVDGRYTQSSTTVTDARSIVADAYAKEWEDYTLELTARKTSGSEGFLVGFAAGGANNFFWWNLGGWNNTRSVLQKADGSTANEVKAVEGHSITTGRDYQVKVVVEGRTIKLYLDGELQIEHEDVVATEEVFQVVTRDADTGDLVAKVVNTSESTQRTTVRVSDVTVLPTATLTELAGAASDRNTKADPTAIVPTTRELTGVSNEFVHDFAPMSVTFLRLRTADGVPPAVDSVDVSGEAVRGWRRAPVTVTAKASDNRPGVVVQTRVDGGAWVPAAGATATVAVAAPGAHEVEVRAVDAAGNVSQARSAVVLIDETAPTTSARVDTDARTVTLRGADDGAGLARIEYRVGSGTWRTYSTPVAVGSAETTVAFRGVDALGNVEVASSVVVPRAGVVLAPSATVAVVSSGSVAFGSKVSVRVRVSGSGGVPSGVVRVLDGSRLVASARLSKGGASVVLPRDLAVGRRALTVSYGGDGRFAGSSDSVVVSVVKASSKVSVKVSPTKVTSRSKAKVAVTVTGAGAKASTVSVKVTSKVKGKSRTVTTRKASVSAKGKATVRLPKLKKGTYTVKVTYAGSSSAKKATKTVKLTVRR